MLKLLVLATLWLAWSGHYSLEEPLIAAFGVGSVLFVVWLDRRMARSYTADAEPTLGLGLGILPYLGYLALETVKANLAVAKIVLSRDLPIQRQLVRIPIQQRSQWGRALHANSITLTPGTITLSVRETSLLVHAIDDAAAAGVCGGEMDKRTRALESDASSRKTTGAGQ